jgi:hypothetical protein
MSSWNLRSKNRGGEGFSRVLPAGPDFFGKNVAMVQFEYMATVTAIGTKNFQPGRS